MASIYQRTRPVRFDEVIGQEHVKEVLLAALRLGRIGHAYLFSGPRGVGKTTSARLLAMALNCDAAPDLRPCGSCESCLLVQRGDHPDVIELDAASNNSVDDVRDLREKVRLAPLRGGRRVWVLDEAHMLSRAAANALLKTLEEPPPGLVFVLATTEPEKLPATVLSRCQHFRFRRLSEQEIAQKLKTIVTEAGVTSDEAALSLVARAADGAMRDAESLLERLLVSGEAITLAAAEGALGLPPGERLANLANALAGPDWGALLEEAGSLYRDGFAPRTIAEQLGRSMRDALYIDVTGDGEQMLGLSRAQLIAAIESLDIQHERFVRQNDLYALEVTLLRVVAALAPREATAAPDRWLEAEAHAPPKTRTAPQTRAEPATGPTTTGPSMAADPIEAAHPAPFDPNLRREKPVARPAPPANVASSAEAQGQAGARFSWHPVMAGAPTQLKAFLLPAVAELSEGVLTLMYDERYAFHHSQLRQRQGELLQLVDAGGGAALQIVIQGPAGTDRHPPRSGGGEGAGKG